MYGIYSIMSCSCFTGRSLVSNELILTVSNVVFAYDVNI